MDNCLINIELIKKFHYFLKETNSLKNLDPNIFECIDKNKEISNLPFSDYYLEYISNLPKLDFESVIKISREVYQLYGKEKDFDAILDGMIKSNSISNGSLNPSDDNFIMKTSESRVLLSGTCYDVVLLCHEVGHKLRYDNSINQSDIIDSFFFETPSIIFELEANGYLRDNYGIDISADELRKTHILSTQKENSVKSSIFSIIINLLKEGKLNVVNLYREFSKDKRFVEYLNRENSSIETCVEEGISTYSYDIGYILGSYVNNSENKVELLNIILKYKDKGITMPFTIEEGIIEGTLVSDKYTK